MKYVEKEVEKQVTENVTTGDPNTITVNMMPSCGCCAGTAYKRYTKPGRIIVLIVAKLEH